MSPEGEWRLYVLRGTIVNESDFSVLLRTEHIFEDNRYSTFLMIPKTVILNNAIELAASGQKIPCLILRSRVPIDLTDYLYKRAVTPC